MVASVQSVAQTAVARATAVVVAFQPGQVLDALVLGKTPDGLTTLRIGDVVVNAQLPQTLPPGTTLQLQVKSDGAVPQLAIVTPPVVPASAPIPQPLPLPSQPASPLPAAVVVQQAPDKAPAAVGQPKLAGGAVIPQPEVSVRPTATPQSPAQPSTPAPRVATQPIPSGPAAQPTAAQAPAVPTQAATVAASVPPPSASTKGESHQSVAPAGAGIAASVAIPAPTGNISAVSAPPASSLVAASPGPTPVAGGAPPPAVAPAAVPGQSSRAGGGLPPPSPSVAAASASPLPAAPQPISAANVQPVAVAPQAGTAAPMRASASASPPSSVELEAANPLLVAQGAPRPQATIADLPKSLPSTFAQPVPQAPAPLPATPQAALAQMLPEALAKQNSLAPLLASLAAIAGKSSALPEPVVRAALQMLAQRIALPAAGPTADILKAAIAKSGVYLEASLAKSSPSAGDLKAGLVALKGALATFLGGNPAPVSSTRQAAPPLKGMPPRAERADPAPLPDGPRELARALHSQADAGLSRVKLMQLASLPDADPLRGPGPELRTELPFLIGSELVMAQLQIFRDGRRSKAEAGRRGWTMRFAMNFSGTGEVGAEVGLLGRSVNVALWAVEPEIAEQLSATLPDLNRALAALGLDAGSVRVRNAPPEPPKPLSGQYLDSVS